MNDYTHIVAALVNFWHIYWHLLLTYWCVNGHCMRPATGSWIRRSKLVRLRLACGTSATGSCREQAPKIGLCHLLSNGFSVVVDPWQNAANWWGSVCHVFDWMFSMIWLCSFHKTTNQTCQQKIEKKNIKSCEINLDLGDNMRQHAHLHRCSICPNGLLQALQDAQSRSLLLIALNSYLCVRVSISAFRLVRCIIFLMKVWQKRHHCTEHWEISKPYVEVLLKILRGSNLYWWSFSRFVGIFQDLMPKHGCRHSADLKLRRICRSIPPSWRLPEIAGSTCHRRQFQADHIITSLTFDNNKMNQGFLVQCSQPSKVLVHIESQLFWSQSGCGSMLWPSRMSFMFKAIWLRNVLSKQDRVACDCLRAGLAASDSLSMSHDVPWLPQATADNMLSPKRANVSHFGGGWYWVNVLVVFLYKEHQGTLRMTSFSEWRKQPN